jgi:hypothetical protein
VGRAGDRGGRARAAVCGWVSTEVRRREGGRTPVPPLPSTRARLTASGSRAGRLSVAAARSGEAALAQAKAAFPSDRFSSRVSHKPLKPSLESF